MNPGPVLQRPAPSFPCQRGQGYPSHTNNSEMFKQPRCALSTGILYRESLMSSVISPVPLQYLHVAGFHGCIPVPPQCGQMIGSCVFSSMAQSFIQLATFQATQAHPPNPMMPNRYTKSLKM